TPQVSSIDLATYLSDFIATHKRKEDIDYQLNVPSTAETIQIDPQHLHEVLEQLLNKAENAINGTAKGVIAINLSTTPERTSLSITDNGHPLTNDQTIDLFDPTFSTTNSQTGLGLPICKRIIEFYSGDLQYAQKDDGNCFVIQLPR
ncbi:MAG: ATP-binding protein, partial [Bacteroidota bacterium]